MWLLLARSRQWQDLGADMNVAVTKAAKALPKGSQVRDSEGRIALSVIYEAARFCDLHSSYHQEQHLAQFLMLGCPADVS
jgi:hypothetical protein